MLILSIVGIYLCVYYCNSQGFENNVRHEIVELETKFTKIFRSQSEEIDKLKTTIETQAVKLDELNERIDNCTSRTDRLEDVCMERPFNKRVDSVTSRAPLSEVAFFAKPKVRPHDLVGHDVLKFDDVITNIGNAYSNTTGIFVCDRPGVYVFFSYLLALQHFKVTSEIVVNNVAIADMHAPNLGGANGSGSNMVVLSLQHNDVVWVRLVDGFGGAGISMWSSFSGFLLYPH